MSHIATVELAVTDLGDLDAACKRLGLALIRGQQTYKWFGQSMGDYPLPEGFTADDLGKCEHAIQIPGNSDAYEIGVVRRRDGKPGFILHWDFFAGGLGMQNRVGADCGLLKQAYAIAAAKRALQAKGCRVTERVLANGSIQLIGAN